jgi:hypothetical protein
LEAENLRIIHEREERKQEMLRKMEGAPEEKHKADDPIEQMREVEEQKAMGFRDLEYRKFLHELKMREQDREKRRSEGYQETLIDMMSRCLCKKIMEYLDKDRCGELFGDKFEQEEIERRDWEGQDNIYKQ